MEILRLIAKLLLDDKPFTDGMKRAEDSAERLDSTLEATEKQTQKFDDALDQTGKTASTTASTLERKTTPAVAATGAQLRSSTADANKFRDALKTAGEAANTIGSALSVAVTAPLTAFGVTALKTAGDFEASMNRVRAITNATGTDFERLEQLAFDLGASTAFSASEAATAMGNLAQAGFSVDETISALPGVLELAAAGGLDLEAAASIAATTLRGFGIDASEVGRVNDTLAKTANAANTDVTKLGSAFSLVAPVAAGLGFSLEETSAAVGQLGNAGIEATSAGTALRAMMTILATRADDLGISVRDSGGNMLPFVDILAQLEAKGFTAEQAMQEFGETGGPGLTALLGFGSESLRALTTDIENAAGTAAGIAATQMEGFNGSLAELSSAFEGLQIAIANSGLLDFVESLVLSLTDWLNQLAALDPELLKIGTAVGAVVAAIGPLLYGFGQLITTMAAVRTGLIAIRTAALLMMGPAGWITLAVVAIAGLTTAFLLNRDASKEVGNQYAVTAEEAAAHTSRIDEANAAYERLTQEARGIIGPINDMRADIVSSTGSVEELQGAVDRAASQMDEEGAAAFRQFAAEAIASGATLEEVGEQIADRAMRTSLVGRVTELASSLDGEGRTAFINYGLQAIATSETAQGALELIMQAWVATQNAAKIGELEIAQSSLTARLQVARAELDASTFAAADLNEEYEAMKARLDELNAKLADRTQTLTDLEAQERFALERQVNAMGEYGSAVDAATVDITNQRLAIAQLESQYTQNFQALRVLRGETTDWARGTATLVTPVLVGTANAAGEANEGVKKLNDEIEYGLDTIRGLRDRIKELNAELETTSDEGRRVELQLEINDLEGQVASLLEAVQSAIDAVDGVRPVTITPTLTIDTAALEQIRAQQLAEALSAPGIQALAIDLAEVRARIVELTRAQVELGEATQGDLLNALNAQVSTLTRLRDATQENSVENLQATQALTQAIAARNALVVVIEEERVATVNANAVAMSTVTTQAQLVQWGYQVSDSYARQAREAEELANQRRIELEQAELLERAGAIRLASDVMAAAERRRITEATRNQIEAEREFSQVSTATAGDVTNAAEAYLSLTNALISIGEASGPQALTALQLLESALVRQMRQTNASSAEYVALAQRLAEVRDGIKAYQDAADAASVAAADSSRVEAVENTKAARATADLTLRKLALADATREQAVASVDSYIAAIQAEMLLTDEQTLGYVALAEELKRVLALKAALEGGGTGAGGIGGTGGGIVANVAEGIRASLDAFAGTLNGFVGTLASFGGVAASLIENVASRVPILGSALDAFSLKFDEGTKKFEASFSPLEMLSGIFNMVLDSSEAVREMFENVAEAMQPFIEVVGEAIAAALRPFLDVAVQLINALAPIIQVAIALVSVALQPLVWILQNIVVPVFTFVANIITAIWNGIASALNRILGVFGVRIPLIERPGAGGGGDAGGGGGGSGGGGTEDTGWRPTGTIASGDGINVVKMPSGNILVSYTSKAPPAGTIARERATLSVLNQALSTAETPEDRAQIRALIQNHQSRLDRLMREGQAEPPPDEPTTEGKIEELRRKRGEAVRRRDAATTDEEIEAANAEIREIDAEIRRLESLGTPAPGDDGGDDDEEEEPDAPAPPPANEQIAALRRERAGWVRRLQAPGASADEKRLASSNIARIDREIRALQVANRPTDGGGEPGGAGGGRRRRIRPEPEPPAPPPPPPLPPRPVVFPEDGLNFSTVTQSVQFAVATPLVEASLRMVEAARLFSGAFSGDGGGLFAAVLPFTAVLERLTPVLDRLIVEGVDVNVRAGGSSVGGAGSLTNVLRPL